MKNFSIENLKKIPEFIAYEPETGNFRRLRSIGNRFKVGEVAGTINNQGYVRIMMFGMGFQAHRLAFYFMTGELPADDLEVDHINGDRSDNKWGNLRLVTHAINMQNSRTPKHNTSGHPGVLYVKTNRKWAARISVKGRMIQLGEFVEKQDAIECYLKAKRKLHEGFVGVEGKAAVLEHQRLSGAKTERNCGEQYVKYC
ncbi:HNH endonuclease signature motif containing protein [Citrobacter portucalensis]|uniref:HNH endonuclease signature motif containing protein n=1 Tax=Citrobacter portucalensis TaxID=1639133 RepID=UPI00164582B0|nr:HNH endonuclease signature motif containing protein [Citrobacter portucalensis]